MSDIWFSGRLYVIACGKWDQAAPPAKSAPRSQLAFGGPFTFEDKFGAHRNLSAEAPWETLTSVLELRHTKITEANADSASRLTLGSTAAPC